MAGQRDPGFTGRLERRPVLLGCFAGAIALGAATGMAYAAGFSATREALERIAPGWLGIAVAARLAAYAGYAVAHHRVMSAGEESDIEAGTAVRVVAFGAGATSLRGGFSIDQRALRGAGASRRKARAHVAALAMFEYAVLAAVAWISALLLIGRGGGQGAVVWPWVIGVPAGVVLASAGYVELGGRLRGDGAVRGRLRALIQGGEILAAQSRRPLRALGATAGMAFYWAAEIAALWASLRAFGAHVSAPIVITGYATGYVLTPRGLPLAGAGIAEVLVPLGLKWLGVGLATAVVAVFAAELTRLLVSIPFALATIEEVQEIVDTG
jgi:uncharacterized membrane protein YbhN (UPF0104 family)